jgi:hypothetical protein
LVAQNSEEDFQITDWGRPSLGMPPRNAAGSGKSGGKRKAGSDQGAELLTGQELKKKAPKQVNISMAFQVVPHVKDPESLIGEMVKVPGSYWNNCDEDDTGKLFKCTVVRCDSLASPMLRLARGSSERYSEAVP